MILVKTPFRISLVGGGTDLPAFYTRNGHGAVVSAAINKYMYIVIHPYFHDKLRVKYSRTEDVDSIEELKHPIVRECLRMMKLTSGLEIASLADIPAGLGLGSSSSFTVCLLHALHAYQGRFIGKPALAEEACHIEIDQLCEPIGKQDQYAATFGGLNYIRFNADHSVDVEGLRIGHDITDELMRRFLVFYIGRNRNASDILREQQGAVGEEGKLMIARNLSELADRLREAIVEARLDSVGEILNDGWQLKKKLASKISDSEIDRIYETGLRAGATGGKLLGAGGGGFMLFYCEPDLQPRVREVLGLRELSVELEREGSKVVYAE